MLLNPILFKTKKQSILLVIASAILYFVFAYNLERTEYFKLFFLYGLLFLLFYQFIRNTKNSFKFLTVIAFLFRFLFIFSLPNLSQDFYRFIWDGRMILEGFNPYLYTPQSFLINNELPIAQAEALYAGMGNLNGSHFTNYPPLSQFCYVLAGIFAGNNILGSVVVLRIIIIAADYGILFFGKKLLQKFNLPIKKIFWYLLNPFIIIELTGNLHFEAVMVFFLVWSLYLLQVGKWRTSAVIYAFSICTKLFPILFLPLFFKRFVNIEKPLSIFKNNMQFLQRKGIIKWFKFNAIIAFTTALLFLPFVGYNFINNYTKTVGLWFTNFEFNASIYYLLREIGYLFRGYNEIAIIGKLLALFVFLFILYLAIFKKNNTTQSLIKNMLFAFTIYLFLSTTVHPWYLTVLVIFSVFTNYKYPLVWSFVIIASYFAYLQIDNAEKSENLYIIALEYIIVFGVFLYEFVNKKSIEN